MRNVFKSFAVAAVAMVATQGVSAATLVVPVTVTGAINEACSTSSTSISFAFGDVVARSSAAATEKTAPVIVNCSTGTPYTFSTDPVSRTDSYAATITPTAAGGTATTGKVTLSVDDSIVTTTTRACGPADLPKTTGCSDSTSAPGKKSIASMTARSGNGSDQSVPVYAVLSDATDTTKTPSGSGVVAVASANLYITY